MVLKYFINELASIKVNKRSTYYKRTVKNNLNNLLLDKRYAVKYNGKTKVKPVSWSKYKQTGELL